jgi:hypothetical protein
MLNHLVLFQLADSATEADRQAIIDGLNSLPASIPEIQSYACGAALPSATGSWSIGLAAAFANADDHKAYSAHPVHQKLVTEVIRPVTANIVSVQFES